MNKYCIINLVIFAIYTLPMINFVELTFMYTNYKVTVDSYICLSLVCICYKLL